MTMDPVIKAKWTAALRSGQYTQGMRKLAYQLDDGTFKYCCLGVLCEILQIPFILTGCEDGSSNGCKAYGDNKDVHSLPYEVQKITSLPVTPDVDVNRLDPKLPFMPRGLDFINDSGSSFNLIADLIDAQL